MKRRLFTRVALAAGIVLLVWSLAPPPASAGGGWVSVPIPRALRGTRGPATRTKTVKISHAGHTGNCRVAVNPDATLVSVDVSPDVVTDEQALGLDTEGYNKCVKENKCDVKIKSPEMLEQAEGVACMATCTAKNIHL